ncbi:cell division protein ZapA [Oceanibium sediminis]|uniref:cell division protein ZapA n=1 Tax=Oceanibium sediminis TaxID=2026339 RepID=UPI000DD30E62|nr:cell division protein ZapA [Oceanibium sediminis]
MPEIQLDIGGRNFRVACEPGQEDNLRQAAALLDTEATTLQDAIGRVPEPRMLLMAGLMLADRTIEIAQQLQAVQEHNDALRSAAANEEKRAAANSAGADAVREARAREEAAVSLLKQTLERVERLAAS